MLLLAIICADNRLTIVIDTKSQEEFDDIRLNVLYEYNRIFAGMSELDVRVTAIGIRK